MSDVVGHGTALGSSAPCAICGNPLHRHIQIVGSGMMCPVSAVFYRPKSERTAEQERARIVAWLRELAGKELSSVEWLQQARSEFAAIIANSIESGAHIKGEGDG